MSGIMNSPYLDFEPVEKDQVSNLRLEYILRGFHPRPSYNEVCIIAKELLERRYKDGCESTN